MATQTREVSISAGRPLTQYYGRPDDFPEQSQVIGRVTVKGGKVASWYTGGFTAHSTREKNEIVFKGKGQPFHGNSRLKLEGEVTGLTFQMFQISPRGTQRTIGQPAEFHLMGGEGPYADREVTHLDVSITRAREGGQFVDPSNKELDVQVARTCHRTFCERFTDAGDLVFRDMIGHTVYNAGTAALQYARDWQAQRAVAAEEAKQK